MPKLPPRHCTALALTLPVLALLAACGGGSSGGSGGSAQGASSPLPSASSQPSATATHRAPARPPGIVAVTKHGALVLLNPVSGQITRTLVPGNVLGDEVSTTADGGTVYFAARHGCLGEIESVPAGGGTVTAIGPGTLPAISPDGSRLAMATTPPPTSRCTPAQGDITTNYTLVIKALSAGTQAVYPMLPPGQSTGLPAPISHLSWSPDGSTLAVSIESVQDNEGWNLILMDPATARDYLSGPGDQPVPATGDPDAKRSYLREGVYLPNGNLFVSRACCAGFPVHNTSRLMWEVTPAGALRHQVAIGFASLDHDSLAVSRNGQWLLYLAGGTLYVSHHGRKPVQAATGLIAATWR
jgi:WD40 repeat protein